MRRRSERLPAETGTTSPPALSSRMHRLSRVLQCRRTLRATAPRTARVGNAHHRYTQTGVPIGARWSFHSQSTAWFVSRTQPCDAADGGTLG